MQNPGIAQTFMVGSALVAKNTWHNYPAPVAIMSAVYEGCQLPFWAVVSLPGMLQ